jgi:hypothetical protein
MSHASGPPHLPTRCPSCKGALIQRMPGTRHAGYISFHCLFCSHIWKFRLDEPRTNPNGELIGDVSIVTKGGRKYKLGSVAVSAIPRDTLKKHLASKTLQAERDSQKLELDIDGLVATLRTAEADEDRLWKILQRDENNPQKRDAWSVEYDKTKNLPKQIEGLKAQRRYLASGEYFFEGLPSGISTAKTDANGKFKLTIPVQGRFGVVARASRELLKGKETYFWFVWVSLDGEPSRRLMLNNENLIGAGSPDSALQ